LFEISTAIFLDFSFDQALNGTLHLLQGLVSAVLWQALQLLDQPGEALHASKATCK